MPTGIKQHGGAKGFSLIEIIIAMAVFSIALVLSIDTFLLVGKNQNRFTAFQGVESDTRYAVTQIVRETQFGTIDYTFYDGKAGGITLNTMPLFVLALKNKDNKTVVYRRSGGGTEWDGKGKSLEICLADITSACQTGGVWEKVTPKDVEVSDLQFFITPTEDPFAPQTNGHALVNGQPKVTLVYEGKSLRENAQTSPLRTQTTVVTRWYKR